jgi:hypothetical protein
VLASFELWARANIDDVSVVPKPASELFDGDAPRQSSPLIAAR